MKEESSHTKLLAISVCFFANAATDINPILQKKACAHARIALASYDTETPPVLGVISVSRKGRFTVNPSDFADWLQGAASKTGTLSRHIIRFARAQDYTNYVRYLRKHPIAAIQPLPCIRALSCQLTPLSTQHIQLPRLVGSIEKDIRIRVHAPKRQAPRAGVTSENPLVPWGIRHIGARAAWKRSRGEQVRIGVIDTGVDFTHPNLRHCLSRGINLINRHLQPTDDNGHGTHIAGTIAAFSRRRGMLGIAPRASIHPIKAFDYQGSAYVSDIINGIQWCIENGMDIINMSFGMKTYSKSLDAAIVHAYQAGIIVVASSGNEGKHAAVDYPARLPQVIAVGATTRQGCIAPFSNLGKQIDLFAPGEKIYSTWPGGKYNVLSGTSMATAHVSGVIALMLARNPRLKPLRILRILRRCGKRISKQGKGSGIIEVRALRSVNAAIAAFRASP